MAEKQNGIPNAVVTANNELYRVNGRISRGYEITVPAEVFEQYRLGYRCIACHHHPQPEPMPDHCCEPYCAFPIKRDQLRLLEFEDRGETDRVPFEDGDYEARRKRLLENDDLWLPELN